MDQNSVENLPRRTFLKNAGIASGVMILDSRIVRGTEANSAVRVGLLGCGGRGTTDATSMVNSAPARIVALADLFDDRLAAARKHFDELAASKGHAAIDASQLFRGPRSSEEMFASKQVDAVIIATPPYFHPEHLAAAVAAGKHVYCEKPVAVDVPGTRRVAEAAKKAQGRVSLDVGFQIRKAPPFVELVRRIHEGALGQIACGEAHYNCGFIEMPDYPGASPKVLRLRHWLHDRVLSGDIIVEQNIHAIDICNWVLEGHPLRAVATGGRKGRTESPGDAWSHFNVVFFYPNDVHVSFSSTQFGANPAFDVNERFFGEKGSSESPYSGPLGISGENKWTWQGSQAPATGGFSASGSFSDNLAQADSEKHADFIHSITSGQFHNQAADGIDSALTCMLGRTAAYTNRPVTWDELVRSNEAWESGIDIFNLS
ncbi:MAG TPA: Gfo/Idh/MocA family oxidoreductase [Bryobacteraceae bacterium]|nr:Gfo/Idh/MocA family oxidoreductase [Bryobacteraceae bacterium]